MNSREPAFRLLVAASSVALPLSAVATCDARSGPNTAALVPRTLLAMITSVILSIGLLLAGGNAVADDMKKDAMAKDGMKK